MVPAVLHRRVVEDWAGQPYYLTPPNHKALERLGMWFLNKWRARLEKVSVYQAAANMRKQGAPIEVALLVLAGRE